jgi:hypothetical protein
VIYGHSRRAFLISFGHEQCHDLFIPTSNTSPVSSTLGCSYRSYDAGPGEGLFKGNDYVYLREVQVYTVDIQ